MLLSQSRHLAPGIKTKVMTTSFLPLCPPLDGDSDLTTSIPCRMAIALASDNNQTDIDSDCNDTNYAIRAFLRMTPTIITHPGFPQPGAATNVNLDLDVSKYSDKLSEMIGS